MTTEIPRTKVIKVDDIIKPACNKSPVWQFEEIDKAADRIRREQALQDSINEMRKEMEELNLKLKQDVKCRRYYKKKPGRYGKKSNK